MSLTSDNHLQEKDWEFVKKLTRVASVHVLSYQVRITVHKSNRDFGTDKDNKLIFPANWSLQYVGLEPSKYEDNHVLTMTWEVLNQ